MDDDEKTVIPTNFTRVGGILIDFVCGLSNALVRETSVTPGCHFIPLLRLVSQAFDSILGMGRGYRPARCYVSR